MVAVLEAIDECTACDPGYYCDSPGLLIPRAQCDAGYVCYSAAVESGPTDGVTGERCPAGYYCEVGITRDNMPSCPGGTYSNVTGAVDSYDCTECEPGFYCDPDVTDRSQPTGPCWGGYYCTGSAAVPIQFNATRGEPYIFIRQLAHVHLVYVYCIAFSAVEIFCRLLTMFK